MRSHPRVDVANEATQTERSARNVVGSNLFNSGAVLANIALISAASTIDQPIQPKRPPTGRVHDRQPSAGSAVAAARKRSRDVEEPLARVRRARPRDARPAHLNCQCDLAEHRSGDRPLGYGVTVKPDRIPIL